MGKVVKIDRQEGSKLGVLTVELLDQEVGNEQEAAARPEAPKTVTLLSRDVTQYKAGQRYDKGDVHGIVRRKDFGKSTIEVELDAEEEPEQES